MKKVTPKTPAATLTKDGVIATFSKTGENDKKPLNINGLGLPDVSNGIYQKLKNNEDITQLFPDVELSIQIMTSSILSPNDMTTTSLIYNVEDMDIPNDINSYIVSEIKKHLNKEYKIEAKLPVMLKEALFTKGAYIEAIIPNEKITTITQTSGEVSLEDLEGIINKEDGLGILSTESHKVGNLSEDDLMLDINDNLSNLLLASKNMELTRESIYQELQTEDLSVEERLYKKNAKLKKEKPIIAIDSVTLTDDIPTKPTIIKLPTVATIPVHMANSPEEHIGYFVLLNDKGTPIVNSNNFKLEDNNEVGDMYVKDVKSKMIQKAKTALYGITKDDTKLKDGEEAYIKLAKKLIKEKLANGSYGDTLDVIDEHELYKIMFHRALSDQKTKILYVPKEYMSYMAFEYRDNGTGKSLLEKVSMLYSIRSILLMSRLMANMKNSVTTTEVSATLSEHDPDPQGTMEKIISETLKTRQTLIPIGINNVNDLVDWSQKVGFRYNIQGKGLPEMSLSVDESGANKIIPDEDLDDKIQESIIMSFGLTKEMVMAGYDPEFATIAISNNVLLAKRVMVYQDKFSEMLSEYVSKILVSDGYIKNKIKDIIKSSLPKIKKMLLKTIVDKETKKYLSSDDNIASYVLNAYIKHMVVSFPKPEVNESTNMKDSLETYIDTVDSLLDILISSDALPDSLTGDLTGDIDDIKSAMKTMLVKEWTISNNYVPEVTNFLTLDNTGKPVFDALEEYSTYTEQLSEVLLAYYKKNKKYVDKTNEKFSKLDEEEEVSEDTKNDNGDSDGIDNNGSGDDNGNSGDSGDNELNNNNEDVPTTDENTDNTGEDDLKLDDM